MMKLPRPDFELGYNKICTHDDLPWDDPKNPKMDFGILLLDDRGSFSFDTGLEKAFLLMAGDVTFTVVGAGPDGRDAPLSFTAERASYFRDDPWCLHVPATSDVRIDSRGTSELAVIQTPNDAQFPVKMYEPSGCRSEERGKGTMGETSTRIVRTIFDKSNAPESNLVLGEVINYPGKWSSYPPHHHPQPEIYHYRFLPEQGFGFSMLGDDAVQVKDGDSVLILDVTHSQTSAPGYAMYYIWPIRHLDGNPYGAEFGTPIFEAQHSWVMDESNQDKIFPGGQ
ncbi:MAG: 5-deoxy-glucuronate isomerase [Promethearchaeota archaeon]